MRLFSLLGFFLVLCQATAATYVPSRQTPPAINREYRGVWVATVANIDWPSSNSISVARQKAELLAMLDRAAELKLNAVFFQVRPGCDALYASRIEPWSEYLTGSMGKAPSPFYDPLALAIREAHARGLELHAWFNPYRARHPSARNPVSATHISKTHPELVRTYGRQLWLDPGEPAVQDHSLRVVLDVVKRYNVDGIHFDDYFYPYKERNPQGVEIPFPDDSSWEKYGKQTGLSREDWRRQNVDKFIDRTYRSIKAVKPWVKFGVSPFGIWRPKNPAQIQGFDAYAELYADSKKWFREGWMDYLVPQLYWAIDPPAQSFPVLLNWWAEQNPKSRHLLAGMDSTKVPRAWNASEIVRQIQITRKQSGVAGHVHWNMKSLLRNPDFRASLVKSVYPQRTVPPALTWLDRVPPGKPQLKLSGSGLSLKASWKPASGDKVRFWVLQTRRGGEWRTEVIDGAASSLALPNQAPEVAALAAVDLFGNISQPAVLEKR
jgi:uncharacterized lipoprotein YddW (UPF0748 family)